MAASKANPLTSASCSNKNRNNCELLACPPPHQLRELLLESWTQQQAILINHHKRRVWHHGGAAARFFYGNRNIITFLWPHRGLTDEAVVNFCVKSWYLARYRWSFTSRQLLIWWGEPVLPDLGHHRDPTVSSSMFPTNCLLPVIATTHMVSN